MTLKELKKHIILCNGATLDNNNNTIIFNSGYLVSVKQYEYKTKLKKLSKRLLRFYQYEAQRLGAFVGLWLNNNILYIDISYLIKDKLNALSIARHEQQQAVFDCKNNASIYLK